MSDATDDGLDRRSIESVQDHNKGYRAGLLRGAALLLEMAKKRPGSEAEAVLQCAAAAIEREANDAGAGHTTSLHGGLPPDTTNQAAPAPAVFYREVSDATWALGWNAALDFLILEAGRIGIQLVHVTSIASFKRPFAGAGGTTGEAQASPACNNPPAPAVRRGEPREPHHQWP